MSKVIAGGKKVLFSDEILQDPYPTYARLHEEGPLHYVEVGGKWAVWSIFSHAECSSIAKDPRLSAKRAKQMLLPLPLSHQSEFSELARILGLWLIFMDIGLTKAAALELPGAEFGSMPCVPQRSKHACLSGYLARSAGSQTSCESPPDRPLWKTGGSRRASISGRRGWFWRKGQRTDAD